ncbi:Monocarboxylate transporter [Phaffia rhodozyma]|uniref:Monocarboxylate transporter n=1 Tax=Phaffia rhodozyma TaxID=264483 RepID=A0A0F7SIE3_PHARH|nr:Monocarboxylate transporter [Phaffia rhodozyma]
MSFRPSDDPPAAFSCSSSSVHSSPIRTASSVTCHTLADPCKKPIHEVGFSSAEIEPEVKGKPEEAQFDTTELDDNLPEISKEECSDGEVLTFPDGGLRAWLAVAGALMCTMSTFGFTNSWGVFQEYYQSINLSNQTSSAIAWVGSAQYCLIFLPAVIMGRLMDIGKHFVPFTIGCVLYVVSVFLIAETHEYYQALLCQGILLGLSAGVLFGPALAILSHWFNKRRSLAYGVVACGSSIGGTAYPILIRQCIPLIGFKWTLRVCGFIIMVSIGFAWLTLRPRLPPKNMSGGIFNFAAFKRPAFSLYVLGCWLIMVGLYTPLSYLDVMGRSQGLGNFSTYLISISNASSVIGRLVPGFFADKVGPINLLAPASMLAGCLMFAWPYCTTKGALIAFAIIYGIFCGSFVSLFSPGVAQLGETFDIGRRMGTLTTCLSLAALIGPPISGAILTKTGSYLSVAGFTGSFVLAGTAIMFASRYLLLKGFWGRPIS